MSRIERGFLGLAVALIVATLVLAAVVARSQLGPRTHCVGRCRPASMATCQEINDLIDATIREEITHAPRRYRIRASRAELREGACPGWRWGIGWDAWAEDIVERIDQSGDTVVWTIYFLGMDADADIGTFVVEGIELRYDSDWARGLHHLLLR